MRKKASRYFNLMFVRNEFPLSLWGLGFIYMYIYGLGTIYRRRDGFSPFLG